MFVGVPKEIKNRESRVALTPDGVREITNAGHQVIVEANAGQDIGFSDSKYIKSGAEIVQTAKEVFDKAELIVKVKEPQPEEIAYIQDKHIIFSYLHLAPDLQLTEALVKTGCTAIAYETITEPNGGLPLLAPMSEVAGRVAVQVGGQYLQQNNGGRGILISGVTGVAPANVVIVGGGIVGLNAAIIASGMGANVVILERSINRIRELEWRFNNSLNVVFSTTQTIEDYVSEADLLIGAVLIPGAKAPNLVTEDMVRNMVHGSVIVDVAVDQGGCIETIHATTHEDPTYVLHDVIHYGVTNMPAAVSHTATRALENSTLPYTLEIANSGVKRALLSNNHFCNGLNIMNGKVTHPAVAESLALDFYAPDNILKSSM